MTTQTHHKSNRKPASAGEQVKDQAGKVWLAGLGALSMAEQEGGKLFRGLVRRGRELEASGKEKLDEARNRVEKLAGSAVDQIDDATREVRGRAGDLLGRVEEEWDERMAAALKRFGVPTREEISRLTRRIEELNARIETKAKPKRRPAAKAAATRRPRKTKA